LFESLAHRYELSVADFPPEWLPLTFLYDPDLPMFPLAYFHALDPELGTTRPGHRDRVFGFIQYVNLLPDASGATVGVVLNKDLSQPRNRKYEAIVADLVRQRIGLGDPVRLDQIENSLGPPLTAGNSLLSELWHRVVTTAFGRMLPFGRNWDPVLGLARFIASWNSDGGRKGELIQTHYFASAFGERIATTEGVHADFYLLPTFEELTDTRYLPGAFPKFSTLISASTIFIRRYCDPVTIAGRSFSSFRRTRATALPHWNTEAVREAITREGGAVRNALFENYNAFNRGPQRSVMALMMLHDLRNGGWDPASLDPVVCAKMYAALRSTYQSPKVIQLYAQQCFGSSCALPIDTWITTFIRWPLGFRIGARRSYDTLFGASSVWGRIERLIWVAVQARKVHASVCAETLWCIRYGDDSGKMRGANPLSCAICTPSIRDVCPAYAAIAALPVMFNGPAGAGFSVVTSGGNASTPGQSFVSAEGPDIHDRYSPQDRPARFAAYPQNGAPLEPSVSEFLHYY